LFKVFYSWQSDIDSGLNRGLIRDALEKAQKRLRAKGIEFEIQESARGVPGSPDIANVILARICDADAVVVDVTIINAGCRMPDGASPRLTPNPNVLIELGFAAGVVGWERIVMAFNSGFGGRDGKPAVPKEVLPFDLGLKQVAAYNLPDDGAKAAERDKLAGMLMSALEAIFLHAQKRKEFEPLLRFIIQKGAEQFGKHGDEIRPFFEQTFNKGNEHLLWAAQNEIVDHSGEGTVRLLDEMKQSGLIVADKTNLGHKTFFLSKKGLTVAEQSGLFRATDPVLQLTFGDPSKRKPIGTSIIGTTILHDAHDTNNLPRNISGGLSLDTLSNRAYWKELAEFVRLSRGTAPIWFVVKNHSGRLAANVRIVIEVVGSNFTVTTQIPERPSPNLLDSIRLPHVSVADSTEIEQIEGKTRIVIHLGSIQPRAEGWSEEPLYVGASESETLRFDAIIFADNLAEPQKTTLTMQMDVTPKAELTFNDLKSFSEQDE